LTDHECEPRLGFGVGRRHQLRERDKAGCKKQIAKDWTAHGVTSIGNAHDDVSFSRSPPRVRLCAGSRCKLRQNGAGRLPEPRGHRSGGIHVNCALIHAPIGLIRAAARSVLSHIDPQADPIENPGQTWLF
jgi:hypothetical protein